MRQPITGACVWTGAEMVNSDRWIRRFPQALLEELDDAAAAVRRRGLSWRQTSREVFPLSSAKPFLEDIREELENGSGIIKIRGLDVGRYDNETLRTIWFGLGSHLGTPLPQNRYGEMMRDIRDEGYDSAIKHGTMTDAEGKPFLSSSARTVTNGPLRFHTDRCDAVGLLCIGQAAQGGHSKLASTAAVHNAMLERRPDLLEVLYRSLPRSRFGEEEGGDKLFYLLPVFGVRDGRITSHYSRTYIENVQLLPDAPRLTAEQLEAMDVLGELAQELSFEMRLEPGDLQLINSHVTYHARTAFENDASRGLVRSLLRLWFAMPNSRALPEDHAVLWRSVEPGALRGGIAPSIN